MMQMTANEYAACERRICLNLNIHGIEFLHHHKQSAIYSSGP